MGCGCGKGQELKDHEGTLAEVNDIIHQQPWRGASGDLSQLQDCVNKMQGVQNYLVNVRGSRDAQQLAVVKTLAERLTQELVILMDIKLMVHKEILRVQEIVKLARAVEALGYVQASVLVGQKHKEVQKEMANTYLQQAGIALAQLTVPDQLVVGAKKVLKPLQLILSFTDDVPELVAPFTQHCNSLGDKMLGMVCAAMDADARCLQSLEEVSQKVDNMCRKCAGASWEALTPRLLAITSVRGREVVPRKLAAIEAELAKDDDLDDAAVLRIFQEMAPWCVELPPELQDRVCLTCQKVVTRVNGEFDKSLGSASNANMDHLVAFAKEYDASCLRMKVKGPSDYALVEDLKRKKAGVTLEELIKAARDNISKQCEDLRAAHEEAKANIAKVPREKYQDRATAPIWRFKLRRGLFKDYSEEKSAEVEQHYQAWVKKGSPTDSPDERRCKISIKVAASAAPARAGSMRDDAGITVVSRPRRKRCKYGESCYQKNEKHRNDFCHPGDPDWDEEMIPVPSDRPSDRPSSTDIDAPAISEMREEKFSLDFGLMTQVNLTRRAAMRPINRVEGLTHVQKHTRDYFGKVREFVQNNETTFSQADAEMRLLDSIERESMRSQVEQLLESMTGSVHDFMTVAVKVGDTKTIDQIVALLGPRAEALGLGSFLKDLRLKDVLGELREAYTFKFQRSEGFEYARKPRKWLLLRWLLKHKILRPRFSLRGTQRALQEIDRRRCYMRCQALLSEYDADKDFCKRFRKDICTVLVGAADWASENQQPHAFDGIVRSAKLLQCDANPVLDVAGTWAFTATSSACKETRLQGLVRVAEVLDLSSKIAAAGGRSLDDLFDIKALLPEIAKRAHAEISVSADKLTESVKSVASLAGQLDYTKKAFLDSFWGCFQPWYESLDTNKQASAVEWAIAFCEQLKEPLPKWMMQKDQVEALRKLQAALTNGGEKELREAVIFAKQADYKSETKLVNLYDQVMSKLKMLKRLPSGWEVADMVGDDAGSKMFKKADLDDPALRGIFQRFFDSTKASIVTRDRVGAVPGGYRVEKVVSVMNAESWGSYLQRRDKIAEQCSKECPAEAPCPEEKWRGWSGMIGTQGRAQEILELCKVPPLENSANEFLLFHGTKPDAADLIAKNHFDMSFACKTGLFGAGLYFAESCSKSDEYVKPDASNQYPLIIARVTLGHMYYCANPDPIKDPGRDKLEAFCRGAYHSVIGDRKKVKGTYREFIVYDHFQVYPHFIVWYTRL